MAVMVDGALLDETRERVLAWFAEAGRDLPWRATRDPYRVLVAEVLAQQTQAARAAAAWPRFLERFPDIHTLAAAAPAEVLRAWQGLGYNRRALALHRTARAVVERGGWPGTVEELAGLPGVGPYTARAVACFALGLRVAPVDTNVARVLGFSTGGEALDTAVSPKGYRLLNKVPRLPGAIVERLVDHFSDLQKLLAANLDDLMTVDGVGEQRARAVREGLSRLAESSILERYV